MKFFNKRWIENLQKVPAFLYTYNEDFLKQYVTSEWKEYELWLYRHRLFTIQMLKNMYLEVKKMNLRPKISIVMPVYNPDPLEFREAVDSILWQVYPHWELCIVDDLSYSRDYLKIFGRVRDRRIKVYLRDIHTGITEASQYAIGKATGEYVAFLDQDDVLHPDAFYSFVRVLQSQDIDFFYSDRDMISPQGKRYMHFFKPGWSPEYLLSFNYVRHLEIYRKAVVLNAGGLRKAYEGSQDYDLALRISEKTDKIFHYPMVLYSWRQSQESIAKDREAKSYVYESGVKAVSDALKRRNLPVKEVFEDISLWRGHYRIKWDDKILSEKKIFLVTIGKNQRENDRLKAMFKSVNHLSIDFIPTDYGTENINKAISNISQEGYVFFCDDTVIEIVSSGLIDMLGYLSIGSVGAAGCKFLNLSDKILNVGFSITNSGKVLFSCKGSPYNEHGYGAAASVTRNVSTVHPAFWGCNVSDLKENGYLKIGNSYIYSTLSFFMDIIKSGKRIVCVPHMCLRIDEKRLNYDNEINAFANNWKSEGMQDKYYNPNLTDKHEDFGLEL